MKSNLPGMRIIPGSSNTYVHDPYVFDTRKKKKKEERHVFFLFCYFEAHLVQGERLLASSIKVFRTAPMRGGPKYSFESGHEYWL